VNTNKTVVVESQSKQGEHLSSSNVPLVSIGLPVYNGEKHLREALDSLLAQTYTNFELIISDDASTDKTFQICKEYELKDKRISVYKNKRNLGSIENFKIVLRKTKGEFFSWAGDHDLWHPEWLQEHVHVLKKHIEIVLVYPHTVRISGTGENLHVSPPVFDTFGLCVKERIKAIYSRGVGFGNMIYGLFRRDALFKVGIYRDFLIPDVLLLWELSLFGSYKQINQEFWFRRYDGLFSIERAKRNCFFKCPWYVFLPWPIVNSAYLLWSTVLSPCAGGISKRFLGIRLSFLFLVKNFHYIKRDNPRLEKYVAFPNRVLIALAGKLFR